MRILFAFCLLVSLPLAAATLDVQVDRNGFTGPIELALAPRVEGRLPEWTATKTLPANRSAAQFTGVEPGLYAVLARGPRPLQRLSAKANVGTAGATLRLAIPKSKTALRVTLGGEPMPNALVGLIQDELRWEAELTTGDDGRFAGELWEPGLYTARVRRDRTTAPHIVDVRLSTELLAIDVPDRHIAGRVTGEDGKPIGGALVALRTEHSAGSLNVRSQSAPDGRFEFFGVPEGAHSLYARAPSYLQTDTVAFELRGAPAGRAVDFALSRGVQRTVRVIDGRGQPLANASLFAACDGHIKSTAATDAGGRAAVALPPAGSCAVYAIPKEGSIGVAQATPAETLVIRIPAGSSSLRLTLKSVTGDPFTDTWLMVRIDGTIVPPAIARHLTTRGLSLVTDANGLVSLRHIPPGTYEFWPYRTEAEGRMLYDIASSFAAPISVNVVTGENDATVKFKGR